MLCQTLTVTPSQMLIKMLSMLFQTMGVTRSLTLSLTLYQTPLPTLSHTLSPLSPALSRTLFSTLSATPLLIFVFLSSMWGARMVARVSPIDMGEPHHTIFAAGGARPP
ncbi:MULTISPECIES: hypothetical protein [unclassified Bradyrhizobium]|jgi:hypothetical protein|uniref:hypothetical protein n=1 Tax=unclassified Bradyrhizobium TaxID=2631580 RepID=UPI0005652D36|nr:hypothetical protein [Bradyrhizobium sp. WSM1253]